ncbi:MAG: efflux RND transporter periplasmic adaptor subunit [Alphaproteobacteria bacterium]|nr:efflux RND transporter periplasmic adaptor subunit [Rhodospirillales bacterium]MCW9045533.1 efflux RND transporter periplasmic adaptor subunit [Alphaproteobacteria bacterium]
MLSKNWFLFVALVFVLNPIAEAVAQQPSSKKGKKAHLVEVVTVEKKLLSFEAVRTGTLLARRSVRVFNQEEGRIDKLPVREGDRVKTGQVIVELDRKLLSVELSKAKATRQEAVGNLARVKELSRRKVATPERLDKAQLAVSVAKAEEDLINTRLGYTKIRAPFDGVVIERLAEPGDIAPKNTHLLTINDPTSLYTRVSVSELMLPRLSKGNPIEVRIDALDNQLSMGSISRIHPVVDPRTRQGIVEVEFKQIPLGAVAGQLCRVKLKTPEVRRLVVPFASLRRDQEGVYVFALQEGKAVIKRVLTGLRLNQQVEVLDGLIVGDKVVVRGFLGLNPGKKVEIVQKQGSSKPQGFTK